MSSESSQPNDALGAIAKGVTKGALEWSTDQIQELARKFQDRELLFIEDREIIETTKILRRRPELEIYRKYIKDRDLILQIGMGFTLRYYETNLVRLHDLRLKILRRYGQPGLHIAEAAQAGIFTKYFSLLLGDTTNETEIEVGLNDFLKNIEKYVLFVKDVEDVKISSNMVVARILSNSPRVFILFSRGSQAIQKAASILETVKVQIRGYIFQSTLDEDVPQQYHFICKAPEDFTLDSFVSKK